VSEINFQIVNDEKSLHDAYYIREVVFMDEQQVPKELEMDEHDDSAIHFIGYIDDEPVGVARIRAYHEPTTAKVERVAIRKEYRGTGLGHKLMLFIEQEAKKRGFTTFKLNAQKYAEEFYQKLGYHTTSEPFDEAGIEHIAMEKKA